MVLCESWQKKTKHLACCFCRGKVNLLFFRKEKVHFINVKLREPAVLTRMVYNTGCPYLEAPLGEFPIKMFRMRQWWKWTVQKQHQEGHDINYCEKEQAQPVQYTSELSPFVLNFRRCIRSQWIHWGSVETENTGEDKECLVFHPGW